MTLGKKLLLAAIIYVLITVLGYFLGLSGNIELLVFISGFLSFGFLFFRLIGFQAMGGRGFRSHVTQERNDLNPTLANKIMQMPSFANYTLKQTLLQIVSIYVMTLILCMVLFFFVH